MPKKESKFETLRLTLETVCTLHKDDECGCVEHLCAEIMRLRKFYWTVADLTVRHDAVADHAVVFPSNLGTALEAIDPDWVDHLPAVRKHLKLRPHRERRIGTETDAREWFAGLKT